MSTFYVDSIAGSDTNSGSIGSPWKSTDRVKTLIANKGVVPGDRVMFKRGGEYFGRFSPVGVENQPPITIGAYGSGPRPKISGYKVANTSGGWTQSQTGVWRIDISSTSTSVTGDVAGAAGNTDIGFLLINGVIKGQKFRNVPQVAASAQWAFTSDSQYAYVRSTANPTTLAADIRIATRGNILTPGSGVRIVGLEVVGTGGHGIRPAAGTAHQGAIHDCYIHECGGGYLDQGSTTNDTRFGNGIELWIGARNWSITYNEISDCYDTGYTQQGTATSGGVNGWIDITFEHNKVWNCSQAVEFWCAADGFTGPGFVRNKVRYNDLINGGYSWGEAWPTNSGDRGVTFLSYAMELAVDIETAFNTVFNAKSNYSFHRRVVNSVESNTVPTGWFFHDNYVALAPGTRMRYVKNAGDTAYFIESAAAWVTAENVERGTVFEIIPANLDVSGNWLQKMLTLIFSMSGAAEKRAQSSAVASKAIAGRLSEAEADLLSLRQLGRSPVPNRPNAWIFPSTAALSTTIAGTSATNALRLSTLVPAHSGKVEAVGIEVTAAGSAGAIVRLVVYRTEGTDLVLVTQGTVSAEATGVIELASDFSIREGEELWVGAVIPAGATTLPTVRGATGASSTAIPIPVASAQFGFANRVNGLQVSGTTGAAPSTIAFGSTGLTTIVPVVGFKTSAY